MTCGTSLSPILFLKYSRTGLPTGSRNSKIQKRKRNSMLRSKTSKSNGTPGDTIQPIAFPLTAPTLCREIPTPPGIRSSSCPWIKKSWRTTTTSRTPISSTSLKNTYFSATPVRNNKTRTNRHFSQRAVTSLISVAVGLSSSGLL